MQILRRFGLAARFASGYLIQLVADQKPLEGPAGTDKDFTDLHAWCEAYVPGAGWVGLDPTSGLLAGEGHIPLACTALPSSAAPVTGFTDVCRSELAVEMTVTRIHEDPRVTRPFDDAQWAAIEALGRRVDRELADGDVRLTMGGEPTFVSVDDMEGAEWNYTAHSPRKFELAGGPHAAPARALRAGRAAPLRPGQVVSRRGASALGAVVLLAARRHAPLERGGRPRRGRRPPAPCTHEDARRFAAELAQALGLAADYALPAYEDPWKVLRDESNLPVGLDPLAEDLADGAVRAKLAGQLAGRRRRRPRAS